MRAVRSIIPKFFHGSVASLSVLVIALLPGIGLAQSSPEWDKLVAAQYQDISAALKIVDDALAKSGKK